MIKKLFISFTLTSVLSINAINIDALAVEKEEVATHIFNTDTFNTQAYRIPALLTTSSGVTYAGADVRFGGGADSPNNIDSGLIQSNNSGKSWMNTQFTFHFDDYPDQPTKNVTDSASTIDSQLVEGHNNRIFTFVDMFKSGIGYPNTEVGSGYTLLENKKYLRLTNNDNEEFYVKEGKVYDKNNKLTNFKVDNEFNLLKDNIKVSNIFYKNSTLTVDNTSFICMKYSDDNGKTWSSPEILNKNLKTDDMKFFGTSPGNGITIKNGKNKDRIVVPIYYTSTKSKTENAAVLFSDDNGQTWNRGETPNKNRIGGESKISESQIVEMPNGQLKMFSRTPGKTAISTSFDGGETWDPNVELIDELISDKNAGVQTSVINYSKKYNKKNIIIFSNPASYNRENGTIRIGQINNIGRYANGEPKYEIDWISKKAVFKGAFGYSSLTELPNHKIGILYEENHNQPSTNYLAFKSYTLEQLMNK
ncbi:sialidase family protein [Mammaliicoccus stepanovicii]|uniref:exo-alpha-sialidase n=1 Tax=Mammaliicoccus stepanovicii TaxID=643214 RepID=A0A239ZCC9_9STAP|nr:sialidase family protein [Mammaliicoccus stepanovicii]PNZ74117.1 exo-alpha-sialidase [Mammaliicoccus stepanovicii]GGI42114.1 hypothetical protein GCM10010896_16800 [Mammaliicoccus stepanovicii]SNV68384.1 putative sialidase, truncated [Mammaliicoccus stepanovicii]